MLKEYTDESFTGLGSDGRDRDHSEVSYEDCHFVKCNFASAKFVRARLLNCTFESCDLSNVDLTSATIRDLKAVDCKLLGINWAAASQISTLVFATCILNYSNFSGLQLPRVRWSRCSALDVELAETNLSGADLRGCDFKGARFAHTNLAKADLRGATNYSIRAPDNTLTQARFSMPEATLLLYGLGIQIEE